MAREDDKRFAPLQHVEAYWHALCEGGLIPSRSQVDPRGIQSALEYAFLIERIAPGVAKFRVAGSHLSELMGMEIGGMPISSLIVPPDRDAFAEKLAKVFAEPAILTAQLLGESGYGRPDLAARMIILPLRSDQGDVNRGIGCMITAGTIGRVPRRFEVGTIETKPALSGLDALPKRPPPVEPSYDAPSRPRLRSFAEPRAGFDHQPSGGARGHLRIVVSNDD